MRSLRTRRASTFRPRLEALEDRLALSVTTAVYDAPTRTWTVNFDGASDTVTITDNGRTQAGIRITGTAGEFHAPAEVTHLVLNMGDGDDHVTYDLRQSLKPGVNYRDVTVNLDVGKDTFTAYVRGVGAGSSGLGVYCTGGDGADTCR
jgi:hypothetical protein